MDLKQLEYFLRVAELGSFTHAAALLKIAQPALSRQVRTLEVELRQTLLLRNGRGALPTPAGQALMEHARGILHQVARAQEDMQALRDERDALRMSQDPAMLNGHISVGLPPSVARVITVDLSKAFRARMPRASLSVSEGLSFGLLESLASGKLDLALSYQASEGKEFSSEVLLDERLAVVAPNTHASERISMAELAASQMILPARPNAIRLVLESAMLSKGLAPTIAFEVDSTSAILEMVAQGLGLAVLPSYAVARPGGKKLVEGVKLLDLTRSKLLSRLYLVSAKLRPGSHLQDETAALIRQAVRGLV